MARRYLTRPLPAPGPAALPAEIAHHLHVLRVRPGDEIVLYDGAGTECRARLVDLDRHGATVAAEEARTVHRGPARAVHAAFALPRGQRAEWIFEHGTEVGLAAFHPIVAAHSRPGGRGRLDRWGRLVAAAAGQCDRSHLPAVHEPRPLDAFLARTDLPPYRVLAVPDAPPLETPAENGDGVLLVGPEGGFTTAEIDAARTAGFVPRSLGPLVLRTETAVLVAAARLLT